ncbi:MAG: hypothetical protein AAFP17_14835 [Pseudomonadota bacterium]
MGFVNFETDVTKEVDISKNVFVDVDKVVFSDVQLEGSLATAEASADALAAGGEGGERVKDDAPTTFAFDDFEDESRLNVDGPDDDTDLPGVSVTAGIANVNRDLFLDVLSAEGTATLGVDDPVSSLLSYSQGNETFSNGFARYTPEAGPSFDLTPEISNEDILNCELFDNFITFESISHDPGFDAGVESTTRISVYFEDVNGDAALLTVLLVGVFDGLSVNTPLIEILTDTPFNGDQPGALLAGTETNGIITVGVERDADNGAGILASGVDFDQLVELQLILEDDPETATDGNAFDSEDFFPLLVDQAILDPITGLPLAGDPTVTENPSTDGTDVDIANINVSVTQFEEQEPGGALAETEVFTQVDETGAFSFADSLSAANFDFSV